MSLHLTCDPGQLVVDKLPGSYDYTILTLSQRNMSIPRCQGQVIKCEEHGTQSGGSRH
jgi:hypothetical protein